MLRSQVAVTRMSTGVDTSPLQISPARPTAAFAARDVVACRGGARKTAAAMGGGEGWARRRLFPPGVRAEGVKDARCATAAEAEMPFRPLRVKRAVQAKASPDQRQHDRREVEL